MENYLFTTLINKVLSPKHAFYDCAALYMDVELRTLMGKLVGMRVWTSKAEKGEISGTCRIYAMTYTKDLRFRSYITPPILR